MVVPQFAGQALVFTPPTTPPRRLSIPDTVGTELQVVPFSEGMGTIEFKLQGPFGDQKPADASKQGQTRLDELTRILIESEENYIGELRSIVEVQRTLCFYPFNGFIIFCFFCTYW